MLRLYVNRLVIKREFDTQKYLEIIDQQEPASNRTYAADCTL
jgi:hypothetical protein